MAAEPQQPRGGDDFLAFWEQHRAQQKRERVRILGVDVEIPTDVPLSFEDTLNELQYSPKTEDVARVLEILFGVGVIDQWQKNGLTGQQLKVLMMWGVANANGKPTTFAEAAELYRQAEELKAQADAEGKATTNRAARRASSRTKGSASTGRSSSATSAASTRSRRKS